MNYGVLLFVVADVKSFLVSQNLLSNEGVLSKPTVAQDVALAQVVETSLRAHGVVIPAQVDAIITLIPFILSLAHIG
jgi:hypothetical protein